MTLKSIQAINQIVKKLNVIEKEYDTFLTEIEKIQELIYQKIEGKIKTDFQYSQFIAIKKQLDNWFQQSGYEKKYEEYIKKIDKLMKENVNYFNLFDINAAYTTIDINVIKLLKESMNENFEVIGIKAQSEIKNYLLGELTVGGKTFKEFKNDLHDMITGVDKRGRSLKHYSYTYANTSVMQMDREMNLRLSIAAKLDTYLYTGGPLLSNSRTFCKNHFGKWFTRSDIDRLSNKIAANSFLQCGGWNCRHMWLAIPKNILISDGYPRGTIR